MSTLIYVSIIVGIAVLAGTVWALAICRQAADADQALQRAIWHRDQATAARRYRVRVLQGPRPGWKPYPPDES